MVAEIVVAIVIAVHTILPIPILALMRRDAARAARTLERVEIMEARARVAKVAVVVNVTL